MMSDRQRARVLITRTRQQASELAARLEAVGVETVLVPTIEIAEPASWCALDAALACLRSFDWVLFPSANAVDFFVRRARQLGVAPHARQIAVVGPATARAVAAAGLVPDSLPVLVPPEYVAESLAKALITRGPQAGVSYLLVRAEEARDVLPAMLEAAGAQVTVAAAYCNRTPKDAVPELRRLFGDGGAVPEVITFTSSSTAKNLFALINSAGLTIPAGVALASIGPITSATLREVGREPTFEASEATVDSLAEATAHYIRTMHQRFQEVISEAEGRGIDR